MRNKEVIQRKLERLAADIKLAGYSFKRNEEANGYKYIDKTLEDINNINTLLNTETQD